jgi:hypothetical protein
VIDKQGSEEVLISMRDNKNVIRLELKQPQITIESVNGKVVLHGKTISIEADDKLELKAKEIEINGLKEVKISSAQIESAASATNTIKGSLVKIN